MALSAAAHVPAQVVFGVVFAGVLVRRGLVVDAAAGSLAYAACSIAVAHAPATLAVSCAILVLALAPRVMAGGQPGPGSPRRWPTTALTCAAASLIVGGALVTSRLAGAEAAGAVAAFPTMCTTLAVNRRDPRRPAGRRPRAHRPRAQPPLLPRVLRRRRPRGAGSRPRGHPPRTPGLPGRCARHLARCIGRTAAGAGSMSAVSPTSDVTSGAGWPPRRPWRARGRRLGRAGPVAHTSHTSRPSRNDRSWPACQREGGPVASSASSMVEKMRSSTHFPRRSFQTLTMPSSIPSVLLLPLPLCLIGTTT
jgi:hypothetical protein